MLTVLVVSTPMALNPTLKMPVHILLLLTARVHKTNRYFLIETWERGWTTKYFVSANSALVAGYDTEKFSTIASKVVALL